MKRKLLYTPDIGYDMSDWEKEPIEKVFAGTNCIVAVTSDGRTLQKTNRPQYALRTVYWTRIKEISLSLWASCHAIGLVSDGTCMVAKRALHGLCEQRNQISFYDVNDEVKSWRDILQVAVSDAYFALDRSGCVHMAAPDFYTKADYAEVNEWRNIRRIATGTQNSVFGVTRDGRVLIAGSNLTGKRLLRSDLAKLHDVYDVCATGAECEEVIVALKDGTVMNADGTVLPVKAYTAPEEDGRGVFQSHFWYETIVLDSDQRLTRLSHNDVSEVFKNCPPIASFAVGDNDYGPAFTIAVAE